MDGVSVILGLTTGCTTCIGAIKSLYEALARYLERDAALERLKSLLEDLEIIITNLQGSSEMIESISTLLRGPIEHCGQICTNIKTAVEKFDSKSKSKSKPRSGSRMTLIDWGRMELSRGSLSDSMDTLEGYKSTIQIGLSIINLGQARVTAKVVEEFTDVSAKTIHQLQIQLQRIEEKLENVTDVQSSGNTAIALDLKNEGAVIEQCITICTNASDYVQDLCKKQSSVLKGLPQGTNGKVQNLFDSQLATQQVFLDNQKALAAHISSLTASLTSFRSLEFDDPKRDRFRAQWEKEAEVSKQCIELLNFASEKVSHQKVHTFGDVIADENCDQMVVASFAELCSIGNATVKKGSMQWVGSVDADVAKQMSADRYRYRSAAANGDSVGEKLPTSSSASKEAQRNNPKPSRPTMTPSQERKARQPTESTSSHGTPSPNEVRKRVPDDGDFSK